MIDRERARVFLTGFLGTFAVVRSWLLLTPDADLNIWGYNIHHLFTGVALLTCSMLPLALGWPSGRGAKGLTLGAAVGLSLVLDEWVYLIVTDGTNASYLLPVSFWGAFVLHAAVAAAVLVARGRRGRP